MAEIVTKDNCIQIDGAKLQRGSRDVIPMGNGVRLQTHNGSGIQDIKFSGSTIDGVAVTSVTELMSFFEAQGFYNGGGAPSEGVQWDDTSMMPVPGKIPVWSEQGLLSTGTPLFPENAVPLVYLDQRLSELPTQGIQSVNSKSGQSIVLNALDVGADQQGSASEAQSNANIYTDNAITGLRVGQANGLAILGSDGKIPMNMLNISGLNFKGAWNPGDNTPTLINGTGAVGDFYKASEAGTFNFGNVDYNFNAGDWVIFAAGVWQRLGSNELVYSVNGKIGEVILNHSDVGALPNTYVPQWSGVQGKPSSSVQDIDDAISKRHVHSNISVLNSISAIGGELSYNGSIISGMPIVSTVSGWRKREYIDRIEYYRSMPLVITVGTGGARYQTVNTGVTSPEGITVANSDECFMSINNGSRTVNMEPYQFPADGIFRVGMFNNYHESGAVDVNATLFVKLVRYK